MKPQHRIERVGTTSVTYDYAAFRLDEDSDLLMASAKQTLVLIELSRRSTGSAASALAQGRVENVEACV